MAIPNNYIDKITNKDSGESRIISPAADKVRVDNENFEGTDLDEVLDEVAQAIGESGSGDGTVTGVKVGSTTYEPTDGVVDITQAIPNTSNLATKTEVQTGLSDKVDKVTGYGLSKNDYTDADKTAVATIPSKANDSDVVKSISVNGGTAQTPTQGNVNIVVEGGSGNVSVIQPDPADGTFIIRVGETDYTINLNHEHPEYAPLVHTHSQYAQVMVVNGESNLPATLDPKTIYGVKADGVDELEMVVIGGYKFYGGGGGAPGQPVLMQPAAGSTINIGTVDNGYGGSTLDPKSKTVNIKARNITQPISISVSGTGFSIENGVSQISAADAIAGTTINVLFDGSSGSQGGTLLLQSTDFGQVPLSVDLAVDYVTYEALGAVGLRGSQWIQTDYIANPNTNIKLVTKFTPNSNTRQTGTIGCVFDSRKNGTRVVSAYFGGNSAENNAGTYLLNFATDGGVVKGSYYQQMRFFTAANTPDNTFCNKGTLNYSGTSASFNNKSITIVRQTTTADHGMTIGINDVADAAPMNAFDVDIYSLEITESGTTVRNYVPIKKSGVPGLYDTVHGTFHSSETDTPLAEVATT